jgi:hypothetical protein
MALLMLLPLSFLPSRLLAPAELCARCLVHFLAIVYTHFKRPDPARHSHDLPRRRPQEARDLPTNAALAA